MLMSFTYSELEKNWERYTPVDVRSPKEYEESTITGAVNIPLFSNEERAAIGTVYKQEGKAQAVRLGIDYISRSLPQIYDSFTKLQQHQKKLLIFCARGGMRSESLGALLTSVGFPAIKLTNGYKGYRRHILEQLPKLVTDIDFITLYGKTGTGKTEILHALQKAGYDVLDLEKCAGHRGSVFGLMGLAPQPSQKQFETNLYDSMKAAQCRIVFTEGESKRIGKLYIPDDLFAKIDLGRKLRIEADIETRKRVILQEYTGTVFDKDGVEKALSSLVRYVGVQKTAEYSAMVQNKQYATVAEELMLKYYDIVYNDNNKNCERSFINISSEETAQEIVKYLEKF